MRIQIRNKEGVIVANHTSDSKMEGTIEIPNVKLWWPYLMHEQPGYLYNMEIFLHSADSSLLDVYRLKIGIRTLSWDNSSFMINDKPIYFRGFGRHEDSDVGYNENSY